MSRKQRQTQLFVVSVIIGALALATLYLGIAIAGYEHAKAQPPQIPQARQTLPQKCQQYYNNGTDEWIDCMGVGYK